MRYLLHDVKKDKLLPITKDEAEALLWREYREYLKTVMQWVESGKPVPVREGYILIDNELEKLWRQHTNK